MKTVALTGRQGPAYGNRSSHTEVEFVTFKNSAHVWVRVSNWPATGRADALRSVLDTVEETVERDGDFGGVEYNPIYKKAN